MTASDNILLVIFLRGGCDGLNLVGPSADPIYQTERRPETRVEREGDHAGLILGNPLTDADFRLHFKAQPLKDLYDAKHLAILHACGLTNGTRSHFEATDYMERGTPQNKNTSTGWLTRLLAQEQLPGLTPVISTTNNLPISLLACSKAIVVPNTRKMTLQGNNEFAAMRDALLKSRYRGNGSIAQNGLHTLQVLDVFASRLTKDMHGKPLDYVPAANANYPTDGYANELSNALKTMAQLVKMDIGVRIATADYGGWDTHVGQGGRFPNLVDGLSRSLMAFWTDMERYQNRLTVVVMSEFGRRLKGNDSGGTDHGHGNAMLVLGGHVNGGRMFGRWPGLANEQLDNQVDLAVTTDYRNVLTEIALSRMPHLHIDSLFPGFSSYQSLGLMQA